VKPFVCSFLLLALFVIAASPPASAATAREKNAAASKHQAAPAKPLGVFTDPNGNTGIGTAQPLATLDVPGEVKLGSTGAACTPQLAGTVRFEHDQLSVCNSRGWQPLTTSAR
jgi:hypothetical protein